MNSRKAAKSIGILVLLLCTSFLTGIVPGAIQPAKAYSIPSTGVDGWEEAVTTTFGLVITNAGDLIVVNVQLFDDASAAPQVNVVSMTDSFGNQFKFVAGIQKNFGSFCGTGGPCYDSEIWYAIANSAGSDLITIQISQASYPAYYGAEALDVVGLTGTIYPVYGASGIGDGDDMMTSTSIPTGQFADSSIMDTCETSDGTPSGGTGFSVLSPYPDYSISAGWSNFGNPSSPPSSPTNFQSACTLNFNWIQVAASFGTVATDVIPCTAYQLQCWLYPFFVEGIYMVLITGMAKFAQVPSRDVFGHLLEAFTVGGLVCVIMGILNVMIPLIITVVQVVRALRE